MNFESAPFKLTQEFVDVMGGLDSSVFAVCFSLFLFFSFLFFFLFLFSSTLKHCW